MTNSISRLSPIHKRKRMCVACRMKRIPEELFRIVMSEIGLYATPPRIGFSGRSIYICTSDACFDRLFKNRKLWSIGTESISGSDFVDEFFGRSLAVFRNRRDLLVRTGGTFEVTQKLDSAIDRLEVLWTARKQRRE
jgi:predicted RNA-binding protein YlxR (DUF448 family)